jgi:hypothetical protein
MLVFSTTLNIRKLSLKGEEQAARPLWIRQDNARGKNRGGNTLLSDTNKKRIGLRVVR